MKTTKITIAIAITSVFSITSCSKSAKQKGIDFGKEFCEVSTKYKDFNMGTPNPEKMAEFQKESNALIEKQKNIQKEMKANELQDFLSGYSEEISKCK